MASKSSLSKNRKHGGARSGAGRKPSLKSAISPTAFAAYEAAQRTNIQRSWIYMPTTNPRSELTNYDRTELLRKAHWMYNNVGIAARAIDGVARYSAPLVPQARTSNSEFNRKAEQLFEDACCTAPFGFDAGAEVNFYEAQPFILRQVALDGDFYWQKILSKNGRGMVRFVGGESVGNSSSVEDKKGWVDGILPDKFGRPIAFNVLDPTDSAKSTIVSVDDMHQVRRMYRRGYLRAPSWLARASNHLQDISEILAYEKASFKLNSQVAFVITSPEAGSIGLGASRSKQSVGDVGSVTVDNLYNASGIPQLKPGEKLESFANLHPNTNFQSFLDYLMRDIAWGMGISPELLWDISGAGGANTRYLLEDANIFFKECQSVIREQFCRPFWTFWIWNEIESGNLPYPGDDWWRADWIAPKPPSVDLGRDGKLYIQLVQSGLMSRKRYNNLMGLDDDQEEDDMIAAAKRLKEKCAAAGLSVSEVIPPLPGAAPIEAAHEDSENTDETQSQGEGMDDLDIEKMKAVLDSVGVAVRAGIITPSKEVESSLRAQLRLPDMSGEVLSEWDRNPIRSPITLTNKLASPDIAAPSDSAQEDLTPAETQP